MSGKKHADQGKIRSYINLTTISAANRYKSIAHIFAITTDNHQVTDISNYGK